MTTPTPSGLTAAICAVMAEVGGIKKTGRNAHHRYEYLTSGDLLGGVQKLMAANGLAMWPSGIERETIGKELHLLVTYTVRHTSGEEAAVVVVSQHAGDKATFAAMTGAQKYAIRQLFCIPDREDPESDENHGPPKRRKEGPAEKKARQDGHDPDWAANRAGFCARLGEIGITYDQLAHALEQRGKPRPSEMTEDQRVKAIGWLVNGGPELVDRLVKEAT